MGRAAIFIDGAYLDFLARADAPDWRPDFRKLVAALTPLDTELLRAYYYTSPPHLSGAPTPEDRRLQRAFDRRLQSLSSVARLDVLHHGVGAHRDLLSVADECHVIDTAFLDSVRRN